MAAVSVIPEDLAPFAEIAEDKAEALIADAMARAARVAPCILDDELSDTNSAAAKAVIRDAILRKDEAGTGVLQQKTIGPFGEVLDTRQPRRVMFWPSEVAELLSICRDHEGIVAARGAYEIDTMPPGAMAGRSGIVL